MIKVQVSVTPNEAKRLIAKAISQTPEVRTALKNGKILLKGGTTISALAEELAGIKLGIHGRITQQGTKSANIRYDVDFHRVLIEGGQVRDLKSDLAIEEVAIQMGKNDVLVTGANALDVNRKTAIMVGRPLGGPAGRILPGLMARGVTTIIAVGWEKLIPCPLEEALAAAGRETMDLAMGMAVGLVPLLGTVVTETDAVSMLADVRTTVIGAGGITGGEGSTTFVIEGEPSQVKKAWEIVHSVKGTELSGAQETLVECNAKSQGCANYLTICDKRVIAHRACIWREPDLVAKVFSVQH